MECQDVTQVIVAWHIKNMNNFMNICHQTSIMYCLK